MDKTRTKLRSLLLVLALIFCFCGPSLSAWVCLESTQSQNAPEAELETDLEELEVPFHSIVISFVSRLAESSELHWRGALVDNRIPRPPETLA